MSLKTGYAIAVHEDGGSLALITGVHAQGLPLGNQVSRDMSAGKQYPAHVSVTEQKPRPTFSTRNIDVALAKIGLTGYVIDGDTNPGLQIVKVVLDTNGQPKSGSSHVIYRIRKGLILPSRLTVPHRGHAELEYMIYPLYDGSNDIITVSTAAALPGTWADTTRYAMGGSTVGSVAVSNKTSLEINFGHTCETYGGDSNLWDTELEVESIAPTITFRGRFDDLFDAASIPIEGLQAQHADTQIDLRKRDQTTAGFVADLTAEHITITAEGLAMWNQLFDQRDNRHGEVELQVDCIWDGTNTPLVIATGQAL